jgi:catechol 2,3-dioxygenase-like lactoylglutathione lyase family enzyme
MPHRTIWHSVPILPFDSSKDSLAFYARLGFELSHQSAHYLMLRKDGVELHLARKGHHFVGDATSCYFHSPDVDRLFGGLDVDPDWIISSPKDTPWRMREFHLRDPFGNILRFGQPSTE